MEYQNGPYADEYESQHRLSIQKCSVCQGLTLATYHWIDQYSDPTDDLGERTLYPLQHNVDDLPERVGRRYTEMLELLYAPDAFAVRAGRLLEAVCADRGIPDGTLHRRLERLANHGDLPRPLADQALLVKEYRNVGGHDDRMEVTPDDVPLLRGFVESLPEFFYWGPKKLQRAAEALEARKRIKQQSP